MNSKDRVEHAFLFKTPDRTPYFRWDNPEKSDIVGAWISLEAAPENGVKNWIDPWGCEWLTDHTDMGQVVKHPMREEDYPTFKIPEVPEEKFESMFSILARYPEKYKYAGIGHFFFETLHFLRGFDNALMDLLTMKEEVTSFFNRLVPFYKKSIDRCAASGVVDGVALNEDLGLQGSLIIRPDLWREIFKPFYKEIYSYAHGKGLSVFQHSCGFIIDVIPDLAETGVNVVEIHQPACMGLERLGQVAQGKICITAPVDIQAVLPYNDKGKIRAFAKEMFRFLDRPEGGLITQTYGSLESIKVTQEAGDFAEQILLELAHWRSDRKLLS